MNFDAERHFVEINDSRRRARDLAAGLGAEQLLWRPHPAKWSIAECISHLNVTAKTVQGFIAKAIEQGKRDQHLGKGPFEIGPRGRFLVWLAEPPPKIKLPAPRGVRPPFVIDDPLKLFLEFLQAQDEWERLVRESSGLDLSRIKVGPRLSLFRARLAAAVPWMMAHQRRHLLQAENVKKQLKSSDQSHHAVSA